MNFTDFIFALSLSSSDIVNICLVIFPVAIGAYIRTKQKADKLEILSEVDTKIEVELAPVKKELKDTVGQFSDVRSDGKVMYQRMEDVFKILSKVDTKIDKNDEYYRDRLQHLSDSKKDKQ